MMDDSLIEEKVERLREIMEQKFASVELARKIAYQELERRLDDLNHSHANMVLDRNQFLRADVHDRFYREFLTYKDELNVRLGQINETLSNYAGRTVVFVGAVGVIVTLIFKFWK